MYKPKNELEYFVVKNVLENPFRSCGEIAEMNLTTRKKVYNILEKANISLNQLRMKICNKVVESRILPVKFCSNEGSKARNIKETLKINPFITQKELIQHYNTTRNYINNVFSLAGRNLRTERKKIYEDEEIYQKINFNNKLTKII